jgi:voltage-gated potassium channel
MQRMRSRENILRQLRVPLSGLSLVFSYGVVGYLLFGHGLLESLHRTMLVLTTVGFSAEVPPSIGEKVFTASIAFLGVAVFFAALAVVGAALAEGHFGITSRRRRMERGIGRLRDHYIICAYGRVGRAVARELEGAGESFVVIDRLEELEDRMRFDGVNYIVDDPTLEPVLRLAGVDRARALVSCVDSDADNVYIVLTARSLQPELFIVARASESAAADRLYRAGADRVISPYVSSGRHMAMLALRPRILDYLEIAAGGEHPLRLDELAIEQDSPLAGRTVAEAVAPATALVVRRADGSLIPNPSPATELRAGDLVVLLGEPAALRAAEGAS